MKHEDVKIINTDEGYIGKSVIVCGWIKAINKSKNICFIELNDRTSLKNCNWSLIAVLTKKYLNKQWN